MRMLRMMTVSALVLALPAMAQEAPTPERLREAVDASIDIDRTVIEGLRVEAAALDQAARNVMAAPGARFTASFRLAAARSLGDAAAALEKKVERLVQADRRLVDAIEARAQARLEIRQSVSEVTEAARSGVFAELDRTPNPLPELLIAKEQGLQALANAEALADRLVPRQILRVVYLLDREVEPEEEAGVLAFFRDPVVDILIWDAGVARLSETGDEVIIEGPVPAGYQVAEIRRELASMADTDALLLALAEDSEAPAPVAGNFSAPGVRLLSIEKTWTEFAD